jgi:hypothetical protein
MTPISSFEGEEVDASSNTANPEAVQQVEPVRRQGLGDRVEEETLRRVLAESHGDTLPRSRPMTRSQNPRLSQQGGPLHGEILLGPRPDNLTPLAYIGKRRADSNQLECMRERVRLLEQELRIRSSSSEPGASFVPGLPTGGQHPALPSFEEIPTNAAAMNLAWKHSLSEGVQLLEPQLQVKRTEPDRNEAIPSPRGRRTLDL